MALSPNKINTGTGMALSTRKIDDSVLKLNLANQFLSLKHSFLVKIMNDNVAIHFLTMNNFPRHCIDIYMYI